MEVWRQRNTFFKQIREKNHFLPGWHKQYTMSYPIFFPATQEDYISYLLVSGESIDLVLGTGTWAEVMLLLWSQASEICRMSRLASTLLTLANWIQQRTGKLLGRMESLEEGLGSQSHTDRNVYIEMRNKLPLCYHWDKRVVYYSDWPILTNTK